MLRVAVIRPQLSVVSDHHDSGRMLMCRRSTVICSTYARSEGRRAAQAMGVLAFELIVGRPPFERESRSSTYEAIMYRRPHFPLWISDSAREFITLALVKVYPAQPCTTC